MKKMFLLFAIMLSSLTAKADGSGKCGDNLTWTYTESTKTLTIGGTGVMYDYSPSTSSWPGWNDNKNIEKILIGSGVTSIGNFAFYNLKKATYAEIANTVTLIGESAFERCSGLTSITIPNGVASIEKSAFNNCTGLTSIVIPNSVTSIGEKAFQDCSGLTSVIIGNNVTSIGDMAFRGCSSIASVVVENGNQAYDSRDQCNAIIKTSSNTLIAGCKTTAVPNSVTCIGDFAFFGCSELIFIIIPNNVTSVGESAFGNCTGLTSVVIGNGVTSIGNYAFQKDTQLQDVYCYVDQKPTTGTDIFISSNRANATLHVPSSALTVYQGEDPWKDFKSIVALTNDDPKPTGIKMVKNAMLNARNYYDLNGRKLSEKPAQKGVYISKGRKVVVK